MVRTGRCRPGARSRFRPGTRSCQLAGTGKTFGLRALAWEWRDWCDFHYIADPDPFFGQHADYLMSVLLQPEYMVMMVPSAHGFIARGGFSSSRRCATNVEFDPLSAGEASEWLAAHGAADGASTQMTLAELYARAEGREAS